MALTLARPATLAADNLVRFQASTPSRLSRKWLISRLSKCHSCQGQCNMQMAWASAAWFLPRLFDRRYGATDFGAINRTVCPCWACTRAQWWAPEQASILIRRGGMPAGHEFDEFSTWYIWLEKGWFACGVHAVQCKDVLRQIDTQGDDGHGFPLP